ncbi:MAG: PAS domain S-box-containing protein [Polaribacter sp.]|jgi:PAS domain S-box-containing protein
MLIDNFEKEKRLKLLEAIEANASYVLISTRIDGTLTSFNKAAESMLGYSSKELVGKQTPAIFHDLEEVVQRSKEFTELFEREIIPGFETLVCMTEDSLPNELEWTYIHKNGSRLPVLLSITALFDESGEKTGYLVIARDISVLRKSENHRIMLQSIVDKQEGELKSSLMRVKLAIKGSNIGVFEWDLVSNELIWDEQMYNIYGTKAEEFGGVYSTWERGLHPEDKERVLADLQETIQENKKFATQFRVLWPSGEVREIKAIAGLVKDKNKKPLKIVGINWDITEASNQKRELELAYEELSQFAYRTSHDLKAPLITVRGLAAVIKEDIEDGEYDEVKKNASIIETHVRKLENLVIDILSLAKADLEVENSKKIEIKEVVLEIKERLKGIYLDNDVKIETIFNHNHDLYVSKTRITQALENFISNAIKYSDIDKEERFVKISTSSEENFFFIQIEDNGLGIPVEYQSRVFNMFERFHQNISFGSGLGMYIAKKHLDKMEAEVDFTSSNKGTRFEIKLKRNKG